MKRDKVRRCSFTFADIGYIGYIGYIAPRYRFTLVDNLEASGREEGDKRLPPVALIRYGR